jgi:hypothetical protein
MDAVPCNCLPGNYLPAGARGPGAGPTGGAAVLSLHGRRAGWLALGPAEITVRDMPPRAADRRVADRGKRWKVPGFATLPWMWRSGCAAGSPSLAAQVT